MKFKASQALVVAIGLTLLPIAASPARAEKSIDLLSGLEGNLERSFSGYRFGLQLTGVGATAALILAGTDATVFRYAGNQAANDAWATPAVYAGYIAPFVLSGGLYLAGRFRHEQPLISAGFAAAQASIVTTIYISTLKFFTGRPFPGEFATDDADTQSRRFRPGLGRGGVIEGWPSGHTAVVTALFTSVASYYESPALWTTAGAVTAYTALAMSSAIGGREHWLSDTVAGALIGYTIGSSVGEGYRTLTDGSEQKLKESRFHFSPILRGDGVGIQIAIWQ